MNNKQGPVLIIESCGCRVDHGIPTRCSMHQLNIPENISYIEEEEFDAMCKLLDERRKLLENKPKSGNLKQKIAAQREWQAKIDAISEQLKVKP